MRASLTDASLARYAGRFVWLELDFDRPANRDFLARHRVTYTPSLFILDPHDDRTIAKQLGGLTLAELESFLDRGAAQDREGRLASLAWELANQGKWKELAGMVTAEAPPMRRGEMFARVVLAGLWAANAGNTEPWAQSALKTLEPLAAEAASLPGTLRDHRFQLYQQLMVAAGSRSDRATVKRWGDRWLRELDATKPRDDDERSALDIARTDAASLMNDPARVIPALILSQRAMPSNYNASLRLAQMEVDAKRYDDAVADCDRGLAHVTGPIARSWLLRIKADALLGKKERAAARSTLEEALKAAQAIGPPQTRERNIAAIQREITATAQNP